jgi:hypothetical protein
MIVRTLCRLNSPAVTMPSAAQSTEASPACYLRFVLPETAGTDSAVSITLYGAAGEAGPFKLAAPGRNCFERGSCDVFNIKAGSKLGQLQRLKVSWCGGSQLPCMNMRVVSRADVTCSTSRQPASLASCSG